MLSNLSIWHEIKHDNENLKALYDSGSNKRNLCGIKVEGERGCPKLSLSGRGRSKFKEAWWRLPSTCGPAPEPTHASNAEASQACLLRSPSKDVQLQLCKAESGREGELVSQLVIITNICIRISDKPCSLRGFKLLHTNLLGGRDVF